MKLATYTLYIMRQSQCKESVVEAVGESAHLELHVLLVDAPPGHDVLALGLTTPLRDPVATLALTAVAHVNRGDRGGDLKTVPQHVSVLLEKTSSSSS